MLNEKYMTPHNGVNRIHVCKTEVMDILNKDTTMKPSERRPLRPLDIKLMLSSPKVEKLFYSKCYELSEKHLLNHPIIPKNEKFEIFKSF
jgi:hypothetical protein